MNEGGHFILCDDFQGFASEFLIFISRKRIRLHPQNFSLFLSFHVRGTLFFGLLGHRVLLTFQCEVKTKEFSIFTDMENCIPFSAIIEQRFIVHTLLQWSVTPVFAIGINGIFHVSGPAAFKAGSLCQ